MMNEKANVRFEDAKGGSMNPVRRHIQVSFTFPISAKVDMAAVQDGGLAWPGWFKLLFEPFLAMLLLWSFVVTDFGSCHHLRSCYRL